VPGGQLFEQVSPAMAKAQARLPPGGAKQALKGSAVAASQSPLFVTPVSAAAQAAAAVPSERFASGADGNLGDGRPPASMIHSFFWGN